MIEAADPAATSVTPIFVLLFAMTPDAAAQSAAPIGGLLPMAEEASQTYESRMESLERQLLGESYSRANRLRRTGVGRLILPGDADELTHADIFRIVHKCGAILWEVRLFGRVQSIDAARWIGWLDLEVRESPARIVWDKLTEGFRGQAGMPELYVPLTVLRFRDASLTKLLERHAHDLVTLLHRDTHGVPLKLSFVKAEIAKDLCRTEEGLWLLARAGAIDVRAYSNYTEEEPRLPSDALSMLLMLEVLCFDRTMLRSFLDQFAQRTYKTVDDLIRLRRKMFDDLEEYYGTLAKTHSYTADFIALGETLFGIHDLFEAVEDRLEALTFEITERNQQSVNQLALWLTTSFGALQAGAVAASIAVWYFADSLLSVLVWTTGTTFATALAIASFLRWKTKT